ncbi:MAG: tandem-95 repeat protein, partial [Chloroflexi bacterium]|nr:tandem-95 repeat protein [Chloroflexota bacterium]
DYGSLTNITINGGSTTGTGTISTSEDDDTDDETFTVALGTLPSSVTAGSPNSVEVTITDDDPRNRPPTVSAFCDPCMVGPSGEVRLTATASDPDGDPLTCAWSTPQGIFLGPIDEMETRWQAPADTGFFTIHVQISDGRGGATSSTVSIEVANAPPVFGEPSYTFKLLENEDGRQYPISLGTVVAEDPDRDEVMYALVSGAEHLFAIGARDGALTYVGPGEDYEMTPNRYKLTVRARDPHGAEATVEVIIEVTNVNEAPVALADTIATAEDEPVLIDVLANDTDIEGDALRVESVSQPMHGTARATGGGNVAYASEADWHGMDRFTYTVADGNGETAQAEVLVRVATVNDAPVALADTIATAEDEPVMIDVLANDTDIEGDVLRVESVSQPMHGTARATGSGNVAYAPEADWHGMDRFTYTVADDNGGTAQAEVLVRVATVNDAPVALGAIPAQFLEEGGEWVAIGLGPYFEDPDGDLLIYTAESSDPSVVSVSVTDSTLTLKSVTYGPVSIVVTARDPDGLSATQIFAVDASDWMVRAVLDETMAAMARAHLASARMTLSRWVGPNRLDKRSRLKVGGHSIPLDGVGMRAAATQRLAEFAMAANGHGPSGHRGPANVAALGRNGFWRPGGTEFLFAWGGEPGYGGWRLWGQGDLQTFAGAPGPERGYKGDLWTGWAGLDRTLGKHWLAGVTVARSQGGGDWRAGTADGRLETSLTAIHPYLRWSNGATSIWTMAGGGQGSAQNARTTGRVGQSGLDLRLGLVEIRRRFGSGFGLRADAAWARLATGLGDETIDNRNALVDQQRLGIEMAASTRLGALALEVFGEASGRRDGGAGQTGQGLEMAGGFRVVGGPVRIDAQGRILLLHSAEGYQERGLGVTLSIGSTSTEEGLSLSVSPRWGGPMAASNALWEERLGLPGPARDETWSLNARGRYALRLPNAQLLAGTIQFDRSHLRLGLNIGASIETPPTILDIH